MFYIITVNILTVIVFALLSTDNRFAFHYYYYVSKKKTSFFDQWKVNYRCTKTIFRRRKESVFYEDYLDVYNIQSANTQHSMFIYKYVRVLYLRNFNTGECKRTSSPGMVPGS